VRRVATLALVAAAAATAAPAAAATRPSLGHLWHAFPLGRAKLVHTPQPTPPAPTTGRVEPVPPARARPRGHGALITVVAAAGTALSVLAVVVAGRRRGWAGAHPEPPSGRRVGTEPRALALYAVAAVIGVLVGLLIPLLA
jgi:hypothetical protein